MTRERLIALGAAAVAALVLGIVIIASVFTLTPGEVMVNLADEGYEMEAYKPDSNDEPFMRDVEIFLGAGNNDCEIFVMFFESRSDAKDAKEEIEEEIDEIEEYHELDFIIKRVGKIVFVTTEEDAIKDARW